MRQAERLEALIDAGVIEAVVRPLLSGKEAEVYLVVFQGVHCVAKLYKEADQRSFKNRAMYTEGRRGRNTRRERAMAKGSKFGRAEQEAAWRTAEVDAIYRLRDAGVAVPEPYEFVDGVLIMELVSDEWGQPAPRLCDVNLEKGEAGEVFDFLLRQVVRMLCAGLVHGDLSDFNVLLGANGPIVIDFPQALDAAANNSARKILVRDVNNLQHFLSRWVPNLRHKKYGEEIWDWYERGELHPDIKLTGNFQKDAPKADTVSLLEEIEAAQAEARRRKGLPPLHALAKPIGERPEVHVELPKRASTPKGNRGGKGAGKGGNAAQGRNEPNDKNRRKNDRNPRNDGGERDRSERNPPKQASSPSPKPGRQERQRGERQGNEPRRGGRSERPRLPEPVAATPRRGRRPDDPPAQRTEALDDLDAWLSVED